MFITAPGLVQHLHPSQVVLPQGHWPAVTLALERPWYLLVHRVWCRQGGARSQTTLVGQDGALIDLLGCMAVEDVMGIARVQRCAEAGPAWALRWVSALWASAPDEAHTLGPLLWQLEGEPGLCSAGLQAVDDGVPGRRRLYAAPGAQA